MPGSNDNCYTGQRERTIKMDEDRKIIARIINGSVDQYRKLVEKYQQPVYRVILKMTGDAENAKELTQDVFVRAYESLEQYNPEYKFFSWVYRIAINTALAFIKRQKRFVHAEHLPEIAEENFNEHDGERMQIIKQTLQKMPVNYKTVIVLKYYAGCSYADIATITGEEEKKVKSRLFDGRKLLKKQLLEKGLFNNF